MATNARRRASAIEDTAAKARTEGWRKFLGATSEKGDGVFTPGRGAYKWIKGQADWAPSPNGITAQNDAIPDDYDADDEEQWSGRADDHDLPDDAIEAATLEPLCDQAAVEDEANAWARLWDEEGKYLDGAAIVDCPDVEPITIEETRMATESFPINTGLGVDHIAPRALARLSDDALGSLAMIYQLCEQQGKLPDEVDLALIVLIPKPDGGTRPICLFPTTVRVWMRARAKHARRWEADNHNPALYGGSGMVHRGHRGLPHSTPRTPPPAAKPTRRHCRTW